MNLFSRWIQRQMPDVTPSIANKPLALAVSSKEVMQARLTFHQQHPTLFEATPLQAQAALKDLPLPEILFFRYHSFDTLQHYRAQVGLEHRGNEPWGASFIRDSTVLFKNLTEVQDHFFEHALSLKNNAWFDALMDHYEALKHNKHPAIPEDFEIRLFFALMNQWVREQGRSSKGTACHSFHLNALKKLQQCGWGHFLSVDGQSVLHAFFSCITPNNQWQASVFEDVLSLCHPTVLDFPLQSSHHDPGQIYHVKQPSPLWAAAESSPALFSKMMHHPIDLEAPQHVEETMVSTFLGFRTASTKKQTLPLKDLITQHITDPEFSGHVHQGQWQSLLEQRSIQALVDQKQGASEAASSPMVAASKPLKL